MSIRRAAPAQVARPVGWPWRAQAVALAAVVALTPTLARGATAPSDAPTPSMPPATLLIRCAGDPFPAAALDGPHEAQRGTDAPARRLAAAIRAAPVSPDSPPRTGWVRVLGRPDLVLFIAPISVRRETDEPLYAIEVSPGSTAAGAVEGWDVRWARPCRPEVVLPAGLGAATWEPASPVGPADQVFVALVTEAACNDGEPATGRIVGPVIIPTATSMDIAFAVQPRPGGHDCPTNPPTPVVVSLPQPLGRRALIDGGPVPRRMVQAPPVPREALTGGAGEPVGIAIVAEPVGRTLAVAGAITDSLQEGVRLRRVRVVDTLRLSLTITADVDTTLAAPPRLCLVGADAAPDDAGLSDRCWGTPDLSALLAAQLPLDDTGHPVLSAVAPITIVAALARGGGRCDFPAGDWTLEATVMPYLPGRPTPEQRLPDVPVTIAWQGDDPMPELTRSDSRYCGTATLVVREQGEPPVAPGG